MKFESILVREELLFLITSGTSTPWLSVTFHLTVLVVLLGLVVHLYTSSLSTDRVEGPVREMLVGPAEARQYGSLLTRPSYTH